MMRAPAAYAVARRRLIRLAWLVLVPGSGFAWAQSPPGTQAIDRFALVSRHNPVSRAIDPLAPLSLGNGRIAFTADVTGLQTFPAAYRQGGRADLPGSTPLATQSAWGWQTFPNPGGYALPDAESLFEVDGRQVPYADRANTEAGQWLRQNPHRLNLGLIGLDLRKTDGAPASPDDLTEIEQVLDLWSGTLTSRFDLDGATFTVTTRVHPDLDLVAAGVRATGPAGRAIAVRLSFPYGSGRQYGDAADWTAPERHRSDLTTTDGWRLDWSRRLDDDTYVVQSRWSVPVHAEATDAHAFVVRPAGGGDSIEFVVYFGPNPPDGALPTFDETEEAARRHWRAFWSDGGAIDLSGSSDPRAPELERRIVLSQYLTAIQCTGPMPPQETGLTYNSWYGKAHLEMHWWHGVHFALWDRLPLLDRSLDWYREILPRAKEAAARQGYAGARWPKMVGPDGREGPSGVGVFLIWQQPHPIYFAELVYRQRPTPETLQRFQEVVFETAEFMASYPRWEAEGQRFVLGPPLIPAQENHPPATTSNPGFELAYWAWGLETAQRWRERMGLPRRDAWDRVARSLADLPERDGHYVDAESAPDPFVDPQQRRDHPTLLAPCGMLPCHGVDTQTMRRTLEAVSTGWDWPSTWGWDYPLAAMTAARLGDGALAVDLLLKHTVKNTYLPNGHNYQRDGLTVYLPGNGGLLTTVAMMAAGWDGAPDIHAPGFPRDGAWRVRWENLLPMP